jgi:hypothetical protein
MKMTIRYALGLAAVAAFATLPIYAQHGHGGGASSSMGSAHSPSASTNVKSGDGKGGSNNSPSSIGEKLTDNTKLASKLQSLLPAGTDLQMASQGFKNLGQFVAAVHVSHNLGIPFDQLKAKMIGPPKESLGKAIEQLKPTANSKTETKKANDQAKQDMSDSGQSS